MTNNKIQIILIIKILVASSSSVAERVSDQSDGFRLLSSLGPGSLVGNRAKKIKLASEASRAGSKEGVQYPLGSLRSRIFSSLFPTKEPGPRLLLSKSRVCPKLTSIWLKSRVWYRVSSKSSVPSFEYRVLTKSSATSCGSHRLLPRLEYRVLSTESSAHLVRIKSSAPSFGASCTNQIVYRVHVFWSR